MQDIRCLHCYSNEFTERNGKMYCQFCGSKYTKHPEDQEMLLSMAYRELRFMNFIDAETAFDDIIQRHPDLPEAYWGGVCARYGIKFEQDYTGKQIPTCCLPAIESILQDRYYLKALALADEESAAWYCQQGEYLERVRKTWIERARKLAPYDIFISYKDSDHENGIERTEDSIKAQSIYTHLLKQGYPVFYSRESLSDVIGEKYEPYIFQALNTSQAMIVYGSKPEYITSTWVRNEWQRYSKKMQKGDKKPGSLIVICDGFSPKDLPPMLRSMQVLDGQDMFCYTKLDAHLRELIVHGRKGSAKGITDARIKQQEKAAEAERKKRDAETARAEAEAKKRTDAEAAKAAKAAADAQKRQEMEQAKVAKATADAQKRQEMEQAKAEKAAADAQKRQEMEQAKAEKAAASQNGEKKRGSKRIAAVIVPVLVVSVGIAVVIFALRGGQQKNPEDTTAPSFIEEVTTSHETEVESVYVTEEESETVTDAETETDSEAETEPVIIYSEGLEFTSNGDGTCYIKNKGICRDAYIVIPEISPDGDTVVGIGEQAFNEHIDLMGIVIPDGVTSIGDNAFYGCEALEDIDLADSVTSIGAHAFEGCTSLEYISIPDSVTSIGEGAFKACSNLDEIILPKGVTSISEQLFYECSFLTSVTLGDGVTSIGDHVFNGCRSLRTVHIPNGVKSIGVGAFSGCESLTDVTLPDSVTSIGEYAFSDCGMQSMVIPDGVTQISAFSFYASDLESITIPADVTEIQDSAFKSCTYLTSIDFQGTMAEWKAITKNDSWNLYTQTYRIHCTDGDIPKSES